MLLAWSSSPSQSRDTESCTLEIIYRVVFTIFSSDDSPGPSDTIDQIWLDTPSERTGDVSAYKLVARLSIRQTRNERIGQCYHERHASHIHMKTCGISPMQRSISPFFSLTCISPVPPGHSTNSNVLPSSFAANCNKGERKCSLCHPTRILVCSVEVELDVAMLEVDEG